MNLGFGNMQAQPWGPTQATSQPVFTFIPTDWNAVLSAADRDLAGILRVRANPQSRASLTEVRSVIDGHIKDLQELLQEAPSGVDISKARRLLDKFRTLRAGKTPE